MLPYQSGDTVVVANSGTRLELGSSIGGGGEGEIFEIVGDVGLVAKIYHKEPRTQLPGLLAHFRRVFLPEGQVLEDGPSVGLPLGLLRSTKDSGTIGLLMYRVRYGAPVYPLDAYGESTQIEIPATCLTLARQIASDVDYFHKAGLIVGDISPRNILVSDDEEPAISWVDLDSFGAVKTSSIEKVYASGKSPGWHAPELGDGAWPSAESDNFSLGLIVLTLMTFRFAGPFDGEKVVGGATGVQDRIAANQAWLLQPKDYVVPLGAATLEDMDPQLRTLAVRLLGEGAAKPERRPSAAEWASALNSIELEPAPVPAGTRQESSAKNVDGRPVGRPVGRAESRSRRRRSAWIGLAAAIAAVIAGLLIGVHHLPAKASPKVTSLAAGTTALANPINAVIRSLQVGQCVFAYNDASGDISAPFTELPCSSSDADYKVVQTFTHLDTSSCQQHPNQTFWRASDGSGVCVSRVYQPGQCSLGKASSGKYELYSLTSVECSSSPAAGQVVQKIVTVKSGAMVTCTPNQISYAFPEDDVALCTQVLS